MTSPVGTGDARERKWLLARYKQLVTHVESGHSAAVMHTAHFGQKYAPGVPYTFHTEGVAFRAFAQAVRDRIPFIQLLAVFHAARLHDSIEDTCEKQRAGIDAVDATALFAARFNPLVVFTVVATTRRTGKSDHGYLRRIANPALSELVKGVSDRDLDNAAEVHRYLKDQGPAYIENLSRSVADAALRVKYADMDFNTDPFIKEMIRDGDMEKFTAKYGDRAEEEYATDMKERMTRYRNRCLLIGTLIREDLRDLWEPRFVELAHRIERDFGIEPEAHRGTHPEQIEITTIELCGPM